MGFFVFLLCVADTQIVMHSTNWYLYFFIGIRIDKELFGVQSWKKLVEVIGSPAGGANSAYAADIADKHKGSGTRINWLHVFSPDYMYY